MNIPFLRKVDRHLGVFSIRILRLFRKKGMLPNNPKKILIIKLFGFGNFIFLSPFFKELKKKYPDAQIHVLTFSQNKEICSMYSDYIDHIKTIHYSTFGMIKDTIAFYFQHKKYDVVIDFEQFVRLSAIIGLLVRSHYFIGICTHNSRKSFAYDAHIEYKENKHVAEEYYSVLKTLFPGKTFSKAELVAPHFEIPKNQNIVHQIKKHFCVGVCVGGRSDDEERRYPKQRSIELLKKMQSHEILLVFFGSNGEKKDIQSIIDQLPFSGKAINLAGTPLPEVSYYISLMKLFISNDTGPLHLAAANNVFCVGMFGPSKDLVYGPFTSKKIIIRDHHKPVRSNHNEKNVGWPQDWWPTPEEAYEKIKKLLPGKKK